MELEDKSDKEFNRIIKELDSSYPEAMGDPDALWREISTRMDRPKLTKFRILYIVSAASVILMIVYSLIRNNVAESHETITYKTEVVYGVPSEDTQDITVVNEALDLLKAECYQNNPVCKEPEFTALKHELEAINLQLENISKQIEVFGKDPAFVHAQIAAENQKAYLLKELIQIIRS